MDRWSLNGPSSSLFELYMTWEGLKPILAKFKAMEATHGPSWPRCPVIAIIEGGLHLAPCVLLIKGVDGKFTPRPKLIIMGLFK